MEAVILAGGFGTRLSGVVKDVPKPMAPVAGRPFLEYVLGALIRQGVSRAVLAVGYRRECIMEHFRSGWRGCEILYSTEDTPLFTGGAVRKALGLCREERVFIVNGDTYFPVDLAQMRAFAQAGPERTALAVKELRDFSRYGAVEFDEAGLACVITEKEFRARGYINGGVYDVPRRSLEGCPERFSLENDWFPVLLAEKRLFCFPSDGAFIDIGIPEDYRLAQTMFGGGGLAQGGVF